MKITIKLLKQLLFKNRYCRHGKPAIRKKVNLEYFDSALNLGDTLSPVICEWILNKRGLSLNTNIKKTFHLMALGSILGGNGYFDAVVWGSGIKSFDQISSLVKRKYIQKLDIRAVRGPLTQQVLLNCGYKCHSVYGDPAVLMPLIYRPEVCEKSGTVLILHYLTSQSIYSERSDVTIINIQTEDYKTFISKIASADRVISSSLHGIILAESYGIPAVFLCEGIEYEMIKFFDWYYSTKRLSVKVATSLEEAMNITPMPLPDLTEMREKLIEAFPYDLWKQ